MTNVCSVCRFQKKKFLARHGRIKLNGFLEKSKTDIWNRKYRTTKIEMADIKFLLNTIIKGKVKLFLYVLYST